MVSIICHCEECKYNENKECTKKCISLDYEQKSGKFYATCEDYEEGEE